MRFYRNGIIQLCQKRLEVFQVIFEQALRKKPDLIKQLTQYSKIPEKITEIGIQVLSVTYQTILDSQYWRDNFGLMVNDSLIIASMQSLKIENLVTNDSDFDHISNLAVWKPIP